MHCCKYYNAIWFLCLYCPVNSLHVTSVTFFQHHNVYSKIKGQVLLVNLQCFLLGCLYDIMIFLLGLVY